MNNKCDDKQIPVNIVSLREYSVSCGIEIHESESNNTCFHIKLNPKIFWITPLNINICLKA